MEPTPTYLTREIGLTVRKKALADRQESMDKVIKNFLAHTPTPKLTSIALMVSIEDDPEESVHRAPLLRYEATVNSVCLTWSGLTKALAITQRETVNLVRFKEALREALEAKYLPHLPDCTVEIHNGQFNVMTASLVLNLDPK